MKTRSLRWLLLCLLIAISYSPVMAQYESSAFNLDISLSQASSANVEKHLRNVAQYRKYMRYLDGIMLSITGVGIVGVALHDNYWIEDTPTKTRLLAGSIGLLFAGIGVSTLSKQSSAEHFYDELLSINDVNERERVGSEQLQLFAEKNRRKRIFTGLGLLAYSAYHFMYDPYDSHGEPGTMWGLTGIGWLLFKSPEERAFNKYVKEVEIAPILDVRFGVYPLSERPITMIVLF